MAEMPTSDQESGGAGLIAVDGDRFELRDDIWIERLDGQLAKNVRSACEPPHYKIPNAELDGHIYAFLMRVPRSPHKRPTRQYEGLETLRFVAALSRLINPTSIGDRFCAQIMHFGLKDSSIRAIQFRGISPDVFLGASNRNWLSKKDGESLREMMPWTNDQKVMHPRINRAFWNHENAMRSSLVDVRWTFVTSGLEALINVGEQDSSRQFRERVALLAAHHKISISADELEKAYKLRSKLVHAENFLHGLGHVLPKEEHTPLYEKLELVLRETVKLTLLDQAFGDSFQNDDAVKRRWPFVSAQNSKKPQRQHISAG